MNVPIDRWTHSSQKAIQEAEKLCRQAGRGPALKRRTEPYKLNGAVPRGTGLPV